MSYDFDKPHGALPMYEDKHTQWGAWWDFILGQIEGLIDALRNWVKYWLPIWGNDTLERAYWGLVITRWYNIKIHIWNTVKVWSWLAEDFAADLLDALIDDIDEWLGPGIDLRYFFEYPLLAFDKFLGLEEGTIRGISQSFIDDAFAFWFHPYHYIERWLGVPDGTISSFFWSPGAWLSTLFGWVGARWESFTDDVLCFLVDLEYDVFEEVGNWFGIAKHTIRQISQSFLDTALDWWIDPLREIEELLGLEEGAFSGLHFDFLGTLFGFPLDMLDFLSDLYEDWHDDMLGFFENPGQWVADKLIEKVEYILEQAVLNYW